jgi:hypothetical protein
LSPVLLNSKTILSPLLNGGLPEPTNGVTSILKYPDASETPVTCIDA